MPSELIQRYMRATGASHSEIQEEMATYADEHGFPIIGPDAGGVLRMLARLTNAEQVFEFGSGYGYSASWFLAGGADELVLTEIDEEELEMARAFLARAGYADRVSYELGDAVEMVETYDGPFDVVLIDHDKPRYADAFERVRGKIAEGGVVVADNMTHGPADLDALVAYFADDEPLPEGVNESTEGVANYIEHVRADPAFESFILPVGSGLCLSTRVAPRDD